MNALKTLVCSVSVSALMALGGCAAEIDTQDYEVGVQESALSYVEAVTAYCSASCRTEGSVGTEIPPDPKQVATCYDKCMAARQ